MPSWNSSAVHDGKLHTNSRRYQTSTSAVRHSVEDDRSVVSTGQLWSSVFAAAGPSTWNSLPDSLHDPSLSLSIFRHHLKTHVFAKDVLSELEIFYENALYKLALC